LNIKKSNKPTIHVIAGVNGSGKTTIAYELIPNVLNENEFLNADEIARGLSPFNFESYNLEAGKILLKRFDGLIKEKRSFAIETTLTSVVVNSKIIEAKKSGYKINLLYVWISSFQLAIKRVELRKLSGGHFIDRETIMSRYFRSLKNLNQFITRIVYSFIIVNNSEASQKIICEKNKNIKIFNSKIWNEITNEK
jgi:predicted ABC-type ATPase